MSEEVLDSSAEAGTGERPVFLTVLCILSFISAGIAIIVLLAATLFAGAVTTAVVNVDGAEVSSGMGAMWAYLIVAIALVVVSLVGVIKMWKLKKQGFMLYSGAAVAGIIVEIALGAGFNVTSVIFTAAFIAMYGVNLKAMK